ncbi:MAG: hypothetical protein JHC52_07780 [Chthoniobacterales bacterium]|jgi:hypothetical protein|nr:hypothetical protein [Chthoniobacterales bacterium]
MGKLRKVFKVDCFSILGASKKAKQPVAVPRFFCGFTACGLRDYFAAFNLYASEAALCQKGF